MPSQWMCKHCHTLYPSKADAAICEKVCAYDVKLRKALGRNIRKEMRHVRAGEHTRPVGLAIAYSKTRAEGYSIARRKKGRTFGSVPRCSLCNLFGHSAKDHK